MANPTNRRRFLKAAVGAVAAGIGIPSGRLTAAEQSERQPGCDYQKCIRGHQYGFRVFGNATPRHHCFFLHGMPVSRLDACYLHEAAERHDVQIISVDRPGIGISDFQADRTLLSTADDVQELAEKLGFGDSFSIIGHSYGCITAAACGLKVRSGGGLKKVALVAPFAPNWMTRVNSKAGRKCREFGFDRIKGPLIFRLMRQAAFSPLPTSQWILRQMAVDLLPKADRHYADSELMVQSLGQDSCQGPAGPLRELQLGICDWDFKLKDIKEGQRFTIWQGTCDTFTPPAVGRFYECGNDYDSGIEGSRYREAPGDGHYSLLGTIDDKIIRSILP